MILSVTFYSYHFVCTILSISFCPIPLCSYTILSLPFCPYHFVRYHFVLEPNQAIKQVHMQISPKRQRGNARWAGRVLVKKQSFLRWKKVISGICLRFCPGWAGRVEGHRETARTGF